MIATTADELALLFRQDVDDVVSADDGDDSDQLWKDTEIYRYMTAACDRLAKDTDGLLRAVTLPAAAGQATVPLPAKVLNIYSMRLVNAGVDVTPRNANELGSRMVNDFGWPRSAMTWTRDYAAKSFVLSPPPTADDTLELSCSVTISAPLSSGIPLPFTDTDDLTLLLQHMKALAYRKHDAEAENLVRARRFDDEYRHGAKERKYELLRQRRQPGVVKPEVW